MATPAGTTCSTEVLQLRIDARDEMCHSRWMKIRWCGMCGVMGSCDIVGIACGCGRNLMLAAFKVAHMSCTQRQMGGAAERGEAHVGGRVVSWVRAASWESWVALVET